MTQQHRITGLRGQQLLDALITGRMTQPAVEALWLAAELWLCQGGVVPMNRYLGLPTSRAKLQQAARDRWLRRAGELLDGNAYRLGVELATFVDRGPWRFWNEQGQPPDDASELRRCLFYAVKFGDEKRLSDRQIYRILSVT